MEDKFKVIRNAERHLIAQQFDRAISDYQQLLEDYGEDPAVLNTLGDLLLRTHRQEEALSCFHRVADIYGQSGFVAKAIALCRKIDQFRPSDPENLWRLSELYRRRGLRSEAGRYLARLAEFRRGEGDREAARQALVQAVELLPEDAVAQRRLGDLLAEESPSDAAGRFVMASRLHLARNEREEALECARESSRLDPGNPDAKELLFELQGGSDLAVEEDGAAEGLEGDETALGGVLSVETSDQQVDDLTEFLADSDSEVIAAPGELDQAETEAPDHEPEAAEEELEEFRLIQSESADLGEPYGEFVTDLQRELLEPEPEVPDDAGATASDEVEPEGVDLVEEEPAVPVAEAEENEASTEPGADHGVLVGESGVEPTGVEPETREEPSEEVEDLLAEAGEEIPGTRDEVEPSLRERLDEVDFYIKLDLRDDARRLAQVLAESYPEQPEVESRLRQLEALESSGSEAHKLAEAGFHDEVEGALEDLFFVSTDEGEGAGDAEELRDDLAQSDYDLGMGYREMEMLDDAAEKFQKAYTLFSDEDRHVEALQCCSMLSTTYLQKEDYRRAAEWADIGLSLPGVQEGEWIQLEYDRALALEKMGETEESLAGYKRVEDRNPGFRDVQDRIAALDSLT